MDKLERKGFSFKLKEIDEEGTFEGYAAVFDKEDLTGDIIEVGAFTKTIQENPVLPICWQHYSSEVIGGSIEVREDKKGLWIKGKLNLEVAKAKEAYSLLKQGVIKGLSIGYDVIKQNWEKGKRKLKELRLWEISLVTFPAQTLALITEVKNATPYQDLPLADLNTEWDANVVRHDIAKWASSDGSGDKDKIDWDKYQKAFFWYDPEHIENFTSYKLPYADIINGKLMAIPRAIFAVAGVLMGGRGGVDITEDEILVIKKSVSKYYEKMDRIPPWEREESSFKSIFGSILEGLEVAEVKEEDIDLLNKTISLLQNKIPESAKTTQENWKPDGESKSLEHLLSEMKLFLIRKVKE